MKAISAQSLFFQETLPGRLAKLRRELLGPSPSPIERLLVDRIVICWMQVHHADWLAANQHLGGITASSTANTSRNARDVRSVDTWRR